MVLSGTRSSGPHAPKLTQAVEQIEPGTEAARRPLPGLVPIPEPYQFLECSRVGHRQVEAAGDPLVVAHLACPAFSSVAYGEVRVGFELRFFIAEIFEAGNAPASW